MVNLYEEQGSGITASDMVVQEENSDIKNFYNDSTILITGATGFLGKLCMEKLLRTCNPRKIYIVIRPKKGKDSQRRFEELFDEPSFDPLKRKFPNFRQKLCMIMGDCALPDLGISPEDRNILEENVNCVFHFAATVKFDEKLRIATAINVRACRDIIRLGKKMKNLKCLVHVSTAFSNCNKQRIKETFYNPPISGQNLISLADCLDDKKLELITPTLIGEFPNTYTFTKCVAEDFVRTEGNNLPIILFRPSIVTATAKEPVAGWIDNVYGATGVLLGAAVGLLHSIQGDPKNRADIVPADYVVNACLATAWDLASDKGPNRHQQNVEPAKQGQDIPVYNYVTSQGNLITWCEFERLTYMHANNVPSDKCVWHYFFDMHPSLIRHKIVSFLAHTVPAHVADLILVCMGKKPMMVKGYEKIEKFADVIKYFTMQEWDWEDDNIKALWKKMKPNDKQLFEFDMSNFNWDDYFCIYSKGARVYILKDPLDTIPQGRAKLMKLRIAHYFVVGILLLILFKVVSMLLNYLFF